MSAMLTLTRQRLRRKSIAPDPSTTPPQLDECFPGLSELLSSPQLAVPSGEIREVRHELNRQVSVPDHHEQRLRRLDPSPSPQQTSITPPVPAQSKSQTCHPVTASQSQADCNIAAPSKTEGNGSVRRDSAPASTGLGGIERGTEAITPLDTPVLPTTQSASNHAAINRPDAPIDLRTTLFVARKTPVSECDCWHRGTLLGGNGLKKNFFVGKLRSQNPPEELKTRWKTDIHPRLMEDLSAVLSWSAPDFFEAELRMAGWGRNEEVVRLKPTVCIRCTSKPCRRAFKKAVKDLDYLLAFCNGNVEVHCGAPRLAASKALPDQPSGTRQISDPEPFHAHGSRESQACAAGTSEGQASNMHMNQQLFVQHAPSESSACGLKLKVVTDGRLEYLSTIGGLIKLENKIFGLTTAHGIFQINSSVPHSAYSDTDTGSESSSSSAVTSTFSTEPDTDSESIPADFPYLPMESRSSVFRNHTQGDEKFEWTKATSIGPTSYCGLDADAEIGRHIMSQHGNADFALIDMGLSSSYRLYNYTPTDNHSSRIDHLQGTKPDKDIRSGVVTLLASPNSFIDGYLIEDEALFRKKNVVFTTRKIELAEPLPQGMSGTWVVQDARLCGVIMAAYDNDPYAHILTADKMFQDIMDTMDIGPQRASSKATVATSLDIYSVCGANSEITIQVENEAAPSQLSEKLPDPTPNPTPTEPSPQVFMESGPTFYSILVALWSCCFLSTFEILTMVTALPRISDALNAQQAYFWIATSFLLASMITRPLYYRLCTIFGPKYLILGALCLSITGNSIASRSHIFAVMITGRSLQGMANAGLSQLSMQLIVDLKSPEKRGLYAGVLSLAHHLGLIVAPIVGGVLGQNTWRWCFYTNIILAAPPLLILAFLLPNSNRVIPSRRGAFLRTDFAGPCLWVASITVLLVGLSAGGRMPWHSVRVIVPTIMGASGCAFFFVYQGLICKEPSLPYKTIRNRKCGASLTITFLGSTLFTWTMWFLPFYFQATKGVNPLVSGINVLPFTGTILASSMLSGVVFRKARNYWKPVQGFGFAIAAIACGLLTMLNATSARVEWVILQVALAVGWGLSSYLNIFALSATLSTDDYRIVHNAVGWVQDLGAIFGFSIPAIIFNNLFDRYSTSIQDEALRVQLMDGASYGYVSSPFLAELSLVSKNQVVSVYVNALKGVWRGSIVVAGLGFFVVFFQKKIIPQTNVVQRPDVEAQSEPKDH